MNRNTQDFPQILEALGQLVRERRSGTLFITTDDNHSARFALEDGEIRSMAYSHLRGYDALPKLQQIRGGSYRFVEGGFISPEAIPLPRTDELLAMIGEAESDDGGTDSMPTGSVRDALVVVRQQLTLHLGPFADIIWDEFIEDNGHPKDPSEFRVMIQTLAEEIDNPIKREEFKRKAKELT